MVPHANKVVGLVLVFFALLLPSTADARSNLPSVLTGLSPRDTVVGCGGCHSIQLGATIAVDIAPNSGLGTLAPGATGTYKVTANTNIVASMRMGVVIAAGDSPQPLSGAAPLSPNFSASRELIHDSTLGALPSIDVNGDAFYTFNYTMPVGATLGTSHTLYAVARVGSGSGGGAWAAAPNLAVLAATVPGQPTGVTATPLNTAASISFGAAPINGSNIAFYRATASPGGATATNTVSPITLSGLTNGTTYTITVTATNAAGTGSGAATTVTPRTIPTAPVIGSALAGINSVSAAFTPTPPANNGGSAITSYTATCGGQSTSAAGSPINVIGLTGGVAVNCTVFATNAAGNSALSGVSNTVTPTSLPGAPTGVLATPGNAQAIVSFSAPVNNGGSMITSYTVTSNPGGFSSTGAALSRTVTGLTNGTSYTFTVTALNGVGSGPSSAPSVAVTPATVPGTPTGVSATPGGNQATFFFTAPMNNGGSNITGYTVTCSPSGTITGAGSPITLAGLTNGVLHSCNVTANNVMGVSVAANVSVTPTAGAVAPTFSSANTTTFFAGSGGTFTATVLGNPAVSVALTGVLPTGVTFTPGTRTISGTPAIGTSGSYLVTLTASNGLPPDATQVFTLVVGKAGQNITFDAIPGGQLVGVAVQLSAVSSSGLPVSFSSATPGVCTISGNNAILVNTGFCTVNADQPGNANFNPTAQIQQSFAVNSSGNLSNGGNLWINRCIACHGGTPNMTVIIPATANGARSASAMFFAMFGGGAGIHSTAANSPSPLTLTNRIDLAAFIGQEVPGTNPSNVAVPYNGSATFAIPKIVLFSFSNTFTLLQEVVPPLKGTVFFSGTNATYTPFIGQFGSDSFTWQATGPGGVSETRAVTLVITNPPAPIITSSSSTTATVGVPFSFSILATNSPTAFASSALPPGLYLNTITGQIYGVPTSINNFSVTLSAIGAGGTGNLGFTIFIVPPPPVITSAATVPGQAFTAFSYSITASNGPTSFSASGLPPGLAVNATTGVISGNPTVSGSFMAMVSASNVSGTGSAALTLNIAGPTLTVTPAGTGSGSVASNPAGISCGATCAANFSAGSVVTLSASANGGSFFAGWSGAGCSGTGSCGVTMNALQTVTPTFSLITVPGAPTGVTALAGDGSASVTFTAPASNGGSMITGYTATCGASGNSGAASPIVVSGLTIGVTVTCTVVANNIAGASAASAPPVSVTPITVPDPPTGLSAMPGNMQATITFTAPLSNGGAGISSYAATCTSIGQPPQVGSAATSPIAVVALVNGAQYDCSVSAANAAGNSAPSISVIVTPRTFPSVPQNLKVTARDGRAILTFGPPADDGGSAITSYGVTCDPGGYGVAGTASLITVYGLVNGTNYDCNVVAINAAGGANKATFMQFAPAVDTGNNYWTQICTGCHATTMPVMSQLNAAGSTRGVLQFVIPNQPSMAAAPQVTDLTADELTAIANYLASVIPASAETIPFNTAKLLNFASQISVGSVSFETLDVVTPPLNGTLSAFTGTSITFTPNAGYVGSDFFTFRGTRTTPSTLLGDPRAVNITVQPPPPQPTINSALAASGTNGVGFNYTITATDSPTSFGATGLPSGLFVNVMSGLINGTPSVAGTFMVTISATNSGGTGVAILVLTLNPGAIAFTGSIGSRKTHAGIDYDLPLDTMAQISGAFTVEPRAIGGGHRIVFHFNNTVSSVTSVSARDANMMPVGTATPSFNSNELIVTLTGVPDNQRMTVTVTGVNGSALTVPVAVGFLIGDVTNNHAVNAADISAVKSRIGPTTGANFMFDLNASGAVSNADVSTVKARSGLVIP